MAVERQDHDGAADPGGPVLLTVVIPVMNEEDSVQELAAEISAALQPLPEPWECLWVDDGSADDTPAVLCRVALDDPHHRVLRLTRNFGQSAALAAGFAAARGRILATLDGDGQNDPKDLPDMLRELLDSGVAMVNGIRAKRHDNWVRRVSSKLANGFRNRLTREQVTDVGCAIRVLRSECVRHIPVFKGMHRFLPTLVRMQGYTITERPVNHRPRTQGKTKYGINNRLWVGIGDTFAVRWMQRRLVWPTVASDSIRASVDGEADPR